MKKVRKLATVKLAAVMIKAAKAKGSKLCPF